MRSSAGIPFDRLVLQEGARRRVSPLLALRVLAGGTVQQIGWALAAFGSVFVWAFGVPALLGSFVDRPDDLVSVEAVLVSSRATDLEINEVRVYEHTFRYEVDGQERTALAYTTGPWSRAEARATALASEGSSHLEVPGTRSTPLSASGVFILLFPLIGLAMVAVDLVHNARGLSLMRRGVPARGKLERVDATRTRINNRTVMLYVFSFRTAEGRAFEARARSHIGAQLTDEALEPILYDPSAPERNVVLGALPGDPRLDEDGGFSTSGWLSPALALLPGAFFFVNGVGLLLLR